MNDATVDGGSMHKVGHGATRWFWLARMRRRTSPAAWASFEGKGAGMTAQDQDGRLEEKNMHKSGESSWVATFCAVALGTLAWAASATAAVRPAANVASGAIGNSVHVVETGLDYPDINAALADAATRDGQTLELAPGIYSGGIVLTKSVHLKAADDGVGVRGGNFHLNAGPTVPPSVVIDGGGITQDGVTIAAGVTGASVSGLEIRNFTRYCVHGVSGNDGLTIDENLLHHCADTGVWINGDVDNVTIDHNEVHTFGTAPGSAGRGIVIWNGVKRDITIDNNWVHGSAGCCGIELQDGTATGAQITNNVVENTGDSGMGFVQLTSGSPSLRANVISGNTVTNTGRFGIEIKIPNGSGAETGDGAIVVENNTISTSAASLRDRAGIAVIRNAYNPGPYPFEVDATQGVVIRDNSVSGYSNTNPAFEGYGIAVEGLGSLVYRNALNNNGIGLQVQQGNSGDQDTANSDWFGRGNAPFSCVDVGSGANSNTFSGNAIDQREVPLGAGMIGGTRVLNQNTGSRYCSINGAIAAATPGDVLIADPGVYAEAVVINKSVTLKGAQAGIAGVNQTGAESVVTAIASDENGVMVDVVASNVTIDGLTVDGDNPSIASSGIADVGGADVDQGYGVRVNNVDNVIVINSVLRNVAASGYRAVDPDSTARSGSRLEDSLISNVGQRGVLVQNHAYVAVVDNRIEDVPVGIQLNSFHRANPQPIAAPGIISGNSLAVSRTGIFHNLFQNNASPYSVTNNVIGAAVSSEAGQWQGIWVESQYGTKTIAVSGNVIDGSVVDATRNTVGYLVNNIASTAPLSNKAITGGSVSHVDVGVLVTDSTLYNGAVNDVLVDNVDFNDIGSSVYYVEDSGGVPGSAKLTLGPGNDVTGVAAATPILTLSGAAPQIDNTLDPAARVFVRSAQPNTYWNGPAQPSFPVTCTSCTVDNALINDGIAKASVNGLVEVEAGTFAEAVLVDKALTLQGPHAGTPGYDISRGSGEAVLGQPASGIPLTVDQGTSNVTVDGLAIDNINGHRMVYVESNVGTGIKLINNRLSNYTADWSAGTGIQVGISNGVEIAGNLLSSFVNGSGYAMGIRLDTANNALIHHNHFWNVQSVNVQVSQSAGAQIHANVMDAAAAPGTGNAGVQVAGNDNVQVYGNTIGHVDSGLLVTPGNTTSVSLFCNTVHDSTRGLFVMGNPPWGGVQTMGPIFHNDIQATSPVVFYNWDAGQMIVGSNYYGGVTPTSLTELIADPLSISPIGNLACGDNSATEIVTYGSTGVQSTDVNTPFANDLRARVQDALGGAVMGAAVNFSDPSNPVAAGATLGTLSGTSNFNGELTTTATANGFAGTYSVTATSGLLTTNPAFSLTNDQGTATVTVTSPSVTYDGSPHAVGVTTTPGGLEGDVQIVYTVGMTTVTTCAATAPNCGPVDAGTYTAIATIVGNPNYVGSGVGTLVINRANTTIEFVPDPANFVYDGNTHAVTARLLAEPATNCPTTGTVGPNVGSYSVNAAACTGSNYQAPASSTSASVTPQPTTISFSHLVQAFDGSPKSVVATTAPTPNVALTITYNGSPTPPTAIGSYAVVATVSDGNYSGSNTATLQIVSGTSDMALVLNGPVDPIHVGDTAQYAATMLANPALHAGEHFGYRVELTKSGGAPLALSDLATMEVFYNGVWEDATTFFGSIPFVLDPITHTLTYNFPDGIPGYSSGFPILDPSWTWNVRFSFATVGTYTVTATLTDGIAGPDISPAVVGSIATVVLPELPPTDIHMALTGPVGSIEVGSVAGYTGTMTADPSLHVGDKFDVRTTIAKTGGNHPLAAADLASIEVFYMGSWQALPPGAFTLVGNELVMDFPNSLIGDGFEIQDPVWTWNFRASWADTGVYTMTAQVIDHAQVMLANPDVFATGAISTTVVAATPHLPDMALLLNGPLDPVELGSAAQYTGTMLAEPSLYTGHTFFVRVRLSKNGGVDAMTAADLVKMELYNGGWFDATSQLQAELHVDGNDLVYLFPQPNAAFPIIDPVWSWNFRFTYGSVGVYGAQADVIDAADAGTIGDAIAAPSLAHAQIDTTVIDTPQISLQLQGAVVGTVGTPVQYVGTLRADPLPNPANLYFVQVRLHKSTGPATVSDISKMEIFWGGQWVDPTQPPYNLSLPFTQDGGDLVYLFPKPIMDNGFPIDEAEWSWQFRFTFADAAVYTATATVVDAGALTAVADPVSIQTDIGPMPDDIRLDLNGPVAGVEEDVPAAYTGRLRNFGGALAENGYVKVRIEMSGETLLVGDVDAEVWDGSAWVAGSLTAVNDGLEVDFPDTAGFPIPAGFDYTHQFRITYHRTGVFHALAAVMGAVSGDVHASAEMFTEVVARSPVTASVSFDPNSLHAVYDGAAHAALASTSPSGLTLVYTYNGNNTAPTQAGSYVVVATIDAGNPANAPYVGSASAILTIDKAMGTVGFAPLTGAYGSVHAVTATLSPVDANSTCSVVAGVPAQNAAVGVYSVSASCTSDNYAASGTASYAVTPAAAGNTGITLTGGSFVYDGASHAATVANPNAVAYTLSYDTGNGSAPINAGNWTATLTVTDPNYAAETLTAPVTITQADVSLVFGDLAHVYDGTPKAASVATVPAGVTGVSLAYTPDAAPTNAGSYLVTATLSNPNYSLTGTTTATLTIAKAVGAVSFGATNFSFDGLPHDTTAVIAQESGTSCTLTPVGDYPRTHAGSTTLAASCDGQNYTASGSTTLTVSPKAVTIALSGLGTFSYDGNVHAASASVTGEVAGFPATTTITYNGSGTAPTDTGSYNVVAALDAGVTDYTAMPVNGLIVIGAANVTVTLSDLSAVYDGNPHAATVVTDPAGLTTSVTYDGSATPPTNAGSYTVVATITQAGYSGSASGTLVIAKAPATVTLNAADLLQTWGSTHAVGVTTDPASLATSITYDGNAGEPANVGSYSVVAVVTDPNYTGSASGTLVITHGDPAQISVVGSAMFSGTAGQPLVGPLPTVKVTDAGGNPVPGVAITFAAGAGDGNLSGATPSTDQNGLASLGGWTLDAAPGTDVVTATAAGVGGNVTFSATSTADSSGLAVSVTDGRAATQVGRVLTWTIMIGNGGNSNLDGVHVEDALPVEMDANGALWQCIAINGATCAASGSGDLDEMIDLPAGSSVVYLLSATVVQDVDGMIENMVSVTHGGNTIVRTDQTEIVIFRDGFEMYGDGSSPRPEGMQPIALGTLGDDQPLMFAIEPQQLPSLQRVSIAQASDRSFTVEAIRIDGVAYLRLIARGDAGEVTTEWSVVAGTQFALLLDGTRLALVGAAADLDLELAHGGSIAVNGAGPM